MTRLQCHIHKIATLESKAFFVLKFANSASGISIQRTFRLKRNYDPSCGKNIRGSCRQFKITGCVYKGKAQNSENCLYMMLTASEQFTCLVLKHLYGKQVLKFSCQRRECRRLYAKTRLHMRPYHPYQLQLIHACRMNWMPTI